MTRNHFQLLLRLWHFADNNSSAAKDDRTHKIKHIFQLVLARFAAAQSPGDSLVIDESMIPFRGRLKFKQYIPGKAHKYGISLQIVR